MSLIVNEYLSGINFNVAFKNKVCVLFGNSGDGKTFAMHILDSYLYGQGVSCCFFDSNAENYTENGILSCCNGKKVILFDNADLYLTQNILDTVYADPVVDFVIISIKDIYKVDFRAGNILSFGLYDTNYDNSTIKIERFRSFGSDV